MTIQASGTALVPQPRRPQPSEQDLWSGGVIACVDSSLSPAVLERSAEWAAAEDCCVVLYATHSAKHRFASLRPTRWSGDGTSAAYEHPLDPVELYVLGQQRLSDAVGALRAAGVRAAGWLPACGDISLGTYVARRSARAVVVSAADRSSIEEVARFRARSRPALQLITV
jgi:hypothetical protein